MGVLWSGILTQPTTVDQPPQTNDAGSSNHGERADLRDVQGLVLDMGDVLHDATIWHRWLWQLLTRMGMHSQFELFLSVLTDDYLNEALCGRQDYWKALRCYLRAIGMRSGQIDEVLAAGHARHRQLEDEIRPLPGVRSTIRALQRQGYRLGLLTNDTCATAAIEQRLDRLGLGGCFQAVFSSAEIGHRAPGEIAFQTVLAALELAPAETVYVGHSRRELNGAAEFGMRTVAVNFEFGAKADFHLSGIAQLAQAFTSEPTRRAG